MILFDKKFREHKRQYVVQSLLAGAAVAAALIFFDVVDHPALLASLGASVFVAFTVPRKDFSNPRRLIAGYAIGIFVGCAFHFVTCYPIDAHIAQLVIHIVAGALAVATAMFLMAITETEHAPAAGIALGFAISDFWTGMLVLKVMAAITLIALIKTALKSKMIDLI